jgi:cytoskeleton protein RodZ
MTVIGETLRRERTRRSLDLDQISRQTKISVKLLEAIENEEFEKLPGGVFTKSFVKQYARALGLDEEEIAHELDRQLQPAPEGPNPESHEISEPAIRVPRVTEWQGVGSRGKQGSVLPALGLVVLVMLICSGVYAWLQRARRPAPMPPEPAAAVTQPNLPPPAGQNKPAESKPAEAPAVQTPPAESLGSSVAAGSVVPTPVAAPAGPIGNPSGSVQVTMKASEPVWVKGWVDGKVVLVTTLQANETRTIGASENVRLRLGNAGGLEVELNGKPLGTPGPKGQIRVLEFTPQGMQEVSIKPPAAPQGPPDIL